MSADPGHSGTPLPRKLGLRPGHRVLVCDLPAGLSMDALIGDLPVSAHRHARHDTYDVVMVFCPHLASLRHRLGALRRRMTADGALWVAWPKKSSGVAGDLDENAVRAHGLAHGLVDVKVCAIDATWSGLKLVVRLRDRPAAASGGR